MNEGTVTVDGQEYIFPPNQVCKPQKTTQNQNQDQQQEDQDEDSEEGGQVIYTEGNPP